MNFPSTDEISKMTPMMRQYYEIKSKVRDAIVFFRMGDFYEIFADDAELVAPKLEITLTSRERGDKKRIKFCGVPHHSAQTYWLRLLKMGYKVSVADQVEDAALAKGLVKRDIVKTLTPGCIDELEGLESDAPNYILACYEDPKASKWAVCLSDVSTGEIRLGSLNNWDELVKAVELYKPKELLIRRFCSEEAKKRLSSYCVHEQICISDLPEGVLRDSEAQDDLWQEVFGNLSLKDQACGEIPGGKELVCALLSYLQRIQISVQCFRSIKSLYDAESMMLNESVVRDLELFETAMHRKAEGSLFNQVNHSLTPMGSRLLRWSLARPLLKKQLVHERHEAIQTLLNQGEVVLIELRSILKGCADIERLNTRLISGRIKPNELVRLRDSLGKIRQISGVLHENQQLVNLGLLKPVFQGLQHYAQPLTFLEYALSDDVSQLGMGDGVFRPGFDQELDQLTSLSQGGQSRVDEYLSHLRERTGIQSLKIKSHKTFGLLIEVTKSNLSKVPDDFIRRQTMVNCERFVTMELKDLDETLVSAKDKAIEREASLYQDFVGQLLKNRDLLRKSADALATFDMIQGFAWLALKDDYCRPNLNKQKTMLLKGSRHPVVESFVGKHQFIPNHIEMEKNSRQLLITGPNMAGKSTVMRQVAISAVLNQAGSFVPALSADMPLFDNIFTRVGASDDLSRGLSTFMVEMSEAAFILRNASSQSLVILDEVGRGTSTEDGLAIAAAILENLATKLNSWTLFATHYHELIPIAKAYPTVSLVQTQVKEEKDNIVFSHRLIPGASGSSFGLEVAQLAGIPSDVLSQAKKMLQSKAAVTLEAAEPIRALKTSKHCAKLNKTQTLFMDANHTDVDCDRLSSIEKRLDRVKLDRTTPLQALNILSDLKEIMIPGKQGSLFQDRH